MSMVQLGKEGSGPGSDPGGDPAPVWALLLLVQCWNVAGDREHPSHALGSCFHGVAAVFWRGFVSPRPLSRASGATSLEAASGSSRWVVILRPASC